MEISLVEDDSDGRLAAVAAGRLDLALVGLADDAPASIALKVIADQSLRAAVVPDHALASRSSVPLRTLAAQDLIALPRGTGGRAALEAACTRGGVGAAGRHRGVRPARPVRHGPARPRVAVLPSSGWEDLALVPIVGPELCSRLALAWRGATAARAVTRQPARSSASPGRPWRAAEPGCRAATGWRPSSFPHPTGRRTLDNVP